MKLLIIGGTGILSTAVVSEAIAKGIDVTVVNRGKNKRFSNPNAETIIGDMRNNPQQVKAQLEGRHFDTVIDFIIWTEDQLKLSLSMFSQLADQYVFISSAQAYNTSVKGVLSEDSEMIQSLWQYSVNKCKAEDYLKSYSQQHGVNYTIIRPGVNYGSTRIPYGMFPAIGSHWTLVERIKAGKYIPTWNNGENRLNLTRVEDFAQGLVGLVGNKAAYNEDFNICGDHIHTWKEVLDVLGELLGTKVKTIDIPVEEYAAGLKGDEKEGLLGGRAQDLVCSNEKMKKAVPYFETKYDLKTGIKMTLDAYKQNGYYNGIDYYYEGKTDRIINKYLAKNNSNVPKQKFVHYNISPSKSEAKKMYISQYYGNNILVKATFKGVSLIKRIIGKFVH